MMFGSDFIVIKDNRGFKTGFHWFDVHTVLENYERDLKWVKVKFRCDSDGSYSLKFIMTLDEFLGQVEQQPTAWTGLPNTRRTNYDL